jgi:hypothetical protein
VETLSEALARLADAGFRDDLVVEDGGLRAVDGHRSYHPEDLVVAEIVRFEGDSNPDDEAIVFALSAADGTPLGTYTTPYGPSLDAADVEVITHLSAKGR